MEQRQRGGWRGLEGDEAVIDLLKPSLLQLPAALLVLMAL
jgi:hypothetical protein